MALELRVCVQNTVCGGVVSRRIHSIGTCFVERSLSFPISSVQLHPYILYRLTGNRTSLVSVPVIVTILFTCNVVCRGVVCGSDDSDGDAPQSVKLQVEEEELAEFESSAE
jgi:hypothetical protein